MTYTHSLFLFWLVASLFTILPLVLTVPHNAPLQARSQDAASWLRDQASQAEQAKEARQCPNVASPVDSWLDYSVKIRRQQSAEADLECPNSNLGLRKREDYSCDEATPCSNGACCGKGGFCGYGADYCGDGTTPNDVCWSNCDARAECGKDADPVNTTCPLNVCCSQYGFCGTTSLFCDDLCQSNCDQPDGSGISGGDVQARVVGYYEGWKVKDNCAAIGLGMKNMPLGSLTHLIVSFGYITPGTFDLEPMPGVDESTFSGFTALKSDNPNTKIMVSLGGWSFSDNGTDTQAVYPDMVSSHDNIVTFVTNLLAFLSHYGFDGVDFDWEYPGAPDRGGTSGDSAGYLNMLVYLRVAMDLAGVDYEVSFTVPTSYYYLSNYATENDTYESNLLKMTEYADMVNVMSYDLHGTWDGPKDQIGSIVLAHTNLTEIEDAFDLFWRIGVDPDKLNLGVGFYGRTYQLSDPSCYLPGCPFSGGADAGSCTGQSGILSYYEIMKIIDQNDITPVWDKVAAVKYIVWKDDQWASFDDEDTFQQKVKWANDNGIGGLSIWAIDLDTDDLQALQGLLYPKTLNAFYDNTTESSGSWQSVAGGQCRLTDCNSKCTTGEVKIVDQKCDDKYGKQGTSELCCPVASAPDPSTCTWRGNPKPCNGRCHADEVAMEQNPWGGGGQKCSDGNKVYCCALPTGMESNCRTTDCGGSCDDDTENSIAGEFYDNCFLEPKQLCCPKDSPYQEDVCYWQGKDGSCYDNVCEFDVEVQLTQSYDGGGGSCGIHLERDRVFCCTAPGGVQPFLPVPLEYLFPDPPTGDNVDTEYKLSVDDTWGTSEDIGDDSTPNDASFGFFVMTSPEELQTSLRKRDGSHWDLFDCDENAVHEEAQTIRMFCNDDSPDSNCHKIFLGTGVPGTILDMPKGCGPGPYAVAVDMVESKNQTIPGHIRRRTTDPSPTVYDLTFDYDFRRVPRAADGSSSTQWRLDYSNEEGYWDTVVDSPGQRRRKRSFEEHGGGNHKRYLEDSWAADISDHRAGLISRDELHARWFGSDAIAWLKALFTVTAETTPFVHTVDEVLNVLLLDETYQCTINNVDVAAKLLVEAQLEVAVDTQFGMTIVATLGSPVDLSGSYLWFKNSGTVQALFSIEALVSARYDTGDVELFGLQNFGATFSIPGILTVGPNFRLYGSVNFNLSLSGSFEAHVTLADWDTQLAFPEAETDADPEEEGTPVTDGTQEVGKPTIDWSIDANGQITAHVKPVISFGLEFNSLFIDVDPATVNLVADGYVTAYASATYGSTDQDFCYGANAGADLAVQLSVPSSMKWALPNSQSRYPIWSSPTYAIIDKTCSSEEPDTTGSSKRSIEYLSLDNSTSASIHDASLVDSNPGHSGQPLSRRSVTIGPLVRIPQLSCPSTAADEGGSSNISGCPLCGETDVETDTESLLWGRWDGTDKLKLTDRNDDPSCALPASYDEDQVTCNYASFTTKRDAQGNEYWSDAGDNSNYTAIDNVLDTRSSLEKRLTQKPVNVYDRNGNFFATIYVGQYKSCSEARSDSSIAKNFLYTNSGQGCGTTIVQLTNAQAKAQAPGLDFETDHVYEAQTLANFIAWLIDGKTLGSTGTWTKPSDAWVDRNILGVTTAGSAFRIVSTALKTDAQDGEIPVVLMAYGFGRSDGVNQGTRLTLQRTQANLALTYEGINGPKGVWFGRKEPTIADTSKAKVQERIRNGAGVFQYLAFTPTTGTPDAIWNKWMRVSNWIDLVLYTFDQQYPWGAGTYGAGEPTSANGGQGSMRSLYAKFIDAELAGIEALAAKWAIQTEDDWSSDYPKAGLSTRDLAWYNQAFGNGGWATATKLRFPRQATGAGGSVYGAYANPSMTLYGTSTAPVAIGAPVAIP